VKVLRVFFWFIIVVAGALCAVALALYLLQSKLVFQPTRELVVTPDRFYLPYEDVYINVTDDEKIHGWYFPADNPDSGKNTPVVLFCHGNAGNIAHRLETADFIRSLGADILLFDYRGYGRSDGSPSEDNAYADAEACYRWLRENKGFQPEQIIIFGRSLGGAVAVELVRRVPCRGLIVESSFTSTLDMGRRSFPFLPIKYLLKYKFDSIAKIGAVTCPVIITHSPDDEIVPYEMGRRLFEAAREPKKFIVLSGGHNEREYLTDKTYREALRDLIQGY
jgi:hypothetical protein